MNDANDLFRYEALAFFGKINASISHELKNIMAIISETAGLLGDLADLASSAKPMEADLLRSCIDSIMEEIQRGFSTIRQMNRFAHSVDMPVDTVNLFEVLDLAVNLCAFLSFTGKPRIIPSDGVKPLALTCPFVLHAIVYQALVHIYRNDGPGTEIAISIHARDDSGWRIIISGFDPAGKESFPDNTATRMAASIGIALNRDSRAGRLEVEIPETMENKGKHDISRELPNDGNRSQTIA